MSLNKESSGYNVDHVMLAGFTMSNFSAEAEKFQPWNGPNALGSDGETNSLNNFPWAITLRRIMANCKTNSGTGGIVDFGIEVDGTTKTAMNYGIGTTGLVTIDFNVTILPSSNVALYIDTTGQTTTSITGWVTFLFT